VQHEGDDTGNGSWTCSRDGPTNCTHVKRARDYLQKLVQEDPEATDRNTLDANSGTPIDYLHLIILINLSTKAERYEV